jgi:two-component system, sensor histidine kinase LadS
MIDGEPFVTKKSLSHGAVCHEIFALQSSVPSMKFSPLFLILVIIGSFLVHTPPSAAERILQLSSGDTSFELAPYLDIFEDKGKNLTIQDVSSPEFSPKFKPLNSGTLNLGITSSAWWARFTIQEKSVLLPGAGKKAWLLESPRPFIASMRLYYPEKDSTGKASGGWRIESIGFSDAPDTGQTDRKFLVFRLPGDYETPATLYLRIEDVTSIFLPLNVCTDREYLNKSKQRMLGFGIFFGIILALALYNLFLFSSLRDRSYLWYSIYIIFIALYFLSTTGVFYQLISTFSPPLEIRLALFFLGLALIGAGQFSRTFLMAGLLARLGDRLILGFMAASAVLCLLTPVLGLQTFHTSFTLLGLAVPLIIIGTGVQCWRRGYLPARFFLLAWVLLCLGGLVFALTLRGVLPYTMLTFYGFQIGSALEAILLSFALADRIKSMQQESEEARHSERRFHLLALTDSLTGLYNYRYFCNQIGLEIQRAEGLTMPLSLVLLDVDKFKKYNDDQGHPEGDKVLAGLGEIIFNSIRDSDLACRYGGDEFALILPGTHVQYAAEVAERIRESMEKKVFIPHPGVKAGLTVSIGVAEHVPGQDPATLITRTDKALYEAKNSGKNKIVQCLKETSMGEEG